MLSAKIKKVAMKLISLVCKRFSYSF